MGINPAATLVKEVNICSGDGRCPPYSNTAGVHKCSNTVEPGNREKANRRTEEYRMSNVEGRYSVDFIKKTERSDSSLRHSTRLSSSQAAVRHSTFFGSLFPWFFGSLFPPARPWWRRFPAQLDDPSILIIKGGPHPRPQGFEFLNPSFLLTLKKI